MDKPKIDDAVVLAATAELRYCRDRAGGQIQEADVRNILEAALNPPPEPDPLQIGVSAGMSAKGWDAWRGYGPVYTMSDQQRLMVAVYRAMECQRLKEVAEAEKMYPIDLRPGAIMWRPIYSHRRKDDPR